MLSLVEQARRSPLALSPLGRAKKVEEVSGAPYLTEKRALLSLSSIALTGSLRKVCMHVCRRALTEGARLPDPPLDIAQDPQGAGRAQQSRRCRVILKEK